jgi:hypothetical protein
MREAAPLRRSEMADMFAAADVLLLDQIGTVKATVIPSKLLTYMAAGRRAGCGPREEPGRGACARPMAGSSSRPTV